MNYDMITEMYEATRYAKELQKKAERGVKKYSNGIAKIDDESTLKILKKSLNKENRKNFKEARRLAKQDTISIGQCRFANNDQKRKYGKQAAKRQQKQGYGRYEY